MPFTNDAVILGILILILYFIFATENSSKPFWKKFYTIIPSLLLCYFVPGILNSMGVIDPSNSQLYFVASRYLLPSSLILLIISVDLRKFFHLGPKAVMVTISATVGIIVGGPLALLTMKFLFPAFIESIGEDNLWRGFSTIAGDWIGGSANQTAMKEIFNVEDVLFSQMIVISVLVGYLWMAVLLFGAGISEKINKLLGSDGSLIENLKQKIDPNNNNNNGLNTRILLKILAVAFGTTALSHYLADIISPLVLEKFPELAKFSLTSKFFWLIISATTSGIILSFTKLKKIENYGASKFGSVFLYILVAAIGMNMDILSVLDYPELFLIAFIWLFIHIIILLATAKIIKAPFFFVATGSMANIGGAASAPLVASAFHPSLAPMGVLLAVIGYAAGTYCAWLCAILMRMVLI